jgi:hypothetical protein
MVIETLGVYFAFMVGERAVELFHGPLSDLHDRVYQVNDAHEAYLSKKKWPEI